MQTEDKIIIGILKLNTQTLLSTTKVTNHRQLYFAQKDASELIDNIIGEIGLVLEFDRNQMLNTET